MKYSIVICDMFQNKVLTDLEKLGYQENAICYSKEVDQGTATEMLLTLTSTASIKDPK